MNENLGTMCSREGGSHFKGCEMGTNLEHRALKEQLEGQCGHRKTRGDRGQIP